MKADTKLIDSNINMCGLVIAYMCGGGQKKAWNVVNRVEEDGLRGMERELVANGVVHGGRWKARGYRLPKLFFESLISCVDHGKLPWICYFKWIGTKPKWNKWTCSISHLCMSVSPIHFYTLARYVVPWLVQSILSSHCTWICVVNEHGRANEHACCVCVCGIFPIDSKGQVNWDVFHIRRHKHSLTTEWPIDWMIMAVFVCQEYWNTTNN